MMLKLNTTDKCVCQKFLIKLIEKQLSNKGNWFQFNATCGNYILCENLIIRRLLNCKKILCGLTYIEG